MNSKETEKRGRGLGCKKKNKGEGGGEKPDTHKTQTDRILLLQWTDKDTI